MCAFISVRSENASTLITNFFFISQGKLLVLPLRICNIKFKSPSQMFQCCRVQYCSARFTLGMPNTPKYTYYFSESTLNALEHFFIFCLLKQRAWFKTICPGWLPHWLGHDIQSKDIVLLGSQTSRVGLRRPHHSINMPCQAMLVTIVKPSTNVNKQTRWLILKWRELKTVQ